MQRSQLTTHFPNPHPHPQQNTKTGAFHRQSHDTFVLDDWLNATRKAAKLGPATLERRSQVQDICANELITQVRIGSPKIATMLERVWLERTQLLMETIRKLRHQASVRDFAQTELFKVARSAGLHAERTKRLGNQWEVQRGAVMEELRDTKSELHSIVIERNQLRKETQQLRDIIQDYIRGVGVKKIKQQEAKKKRVQMEQENKTMSVAEEQEQAARHRIKEKIVEEVQEYDTEQNRAGNRRTNDRVHDDVHYESEEEDLNDRSVRMRVKSIKEADRQMDALLLDLMGEKRAQKAAIRGTQRLMKQFLSTIEAQSLNVR